ncbi:MAG TPA: hypothetical protein VLW17_03700, partial [Thermoanaerobaculaceae bacterium]|nr:hypothetical protein [Thermoanaerobaculaceae bacterium]
KLAWYLVMHLFLAAGFLTKNVVAWIVPALAWLTLVAWERRWRELAAWELWAGVALQAALVLPWVAAVAAEPAGATYLRIFFRDNLLGRFTPVEGVGYTQSHRGWPGMYLAELPVYVFPWLFVAAAALAAAWRASRETGERAGEDAAVSRFALGAIVPPLLLLSASTTMRDIYAGVLMPGIALAGGVWFARARLAPRRLDVAMTRATAALFLALAALVPPAVVAAVLHFGAPSPAWALAALAAGWVAGVALAWRGWRAARNGRIAASLACAALIAVLAAPALAPLVVPVVNRSQSLRPVALAAREAAAGRPLALWRPDETLIAVMDFEVGLTPPAVPDPAAARQRLAAEPGLVLVGQTWPGKQREGDAGGLARELGLDVLRRVDLPQPGGRSYLVLGRPGR